MMNLMEYPFLFFILSFIVFYASTWIGRILASRWQMDKEVREDFNVILATALTTLGLLIGFCFSMATNRYDQRKNFEAEEANAIGTEYLRVELLPAPDAAIARTLLKRYVDERVLFYTTWDKESRAEIRRRVSRMQGEMWSSVLTSARAKPDPLTAAVVTGMNDVINSEGYAQAALWNRIPLQAWALLTIIAVCCNVMMGYGIRKYERARILLMIVPFVVSVSFFLLAEIDSPYNGLIRVYPKNLERLAEQLRAN